MARKHRSRYSTSKFFNKETWPHCIPITKKTHSLFFLCRLQSSVARGSGQKLHVLFFLKSPLLSRGCFGQRPKVRKKASKVRKKASSPDPSGKVGPFFFNAYLFLASGLSVGVRLVRPCFQSCPWVSVWSVCFLSSRLCLCVGRWGIQKHLSIPYCRACADCNLELRAARVKKTLYIYIVIYNYTKASRL